MSTFLDWIARLWAPWTTEASVQTDLAMHDRRIARLEIEMADNSQLLHDVAGGLRDLGPKIAALVAENNELRGEDAAESAAAADVKSAFDGVAHLFDQSDEVPTPEPVPAEPVQDAPVEQPADQAVPVEQQLPDDAA